MTISLFVKALGGLVFLLAMLGLALFLPAGSIDYWQAWVYLALFSLCTGGITLYLMRRDPALLQRRVGVGAVAEARTGQKIVQAIAQLSFLGLLVVPAFDHRLAWSSVPLLGVLLGDALVVGGLSIVFVVFRENSFASLTVEVDKTQEVISSGPYSRVRHPMYSGAFVMLVGTPIALGSFWGLLSFIPIASVITWRLLDEEKFLSKNLRGYTEYCAKVRSRLIPGVF